MIASIFNVAYVMKIWLLILYGMGYDQQHSSLIFSGIFSLHSSLVSSKTLKNQPVPRILTINHV